MSFALGGSQTLVWVSLRPVRTVAPEGLAPRPDRHERSALTLERRVPDGERRQPGRPGADATPLPRCALPLPIPA